MTEKPLWKYVETSEGVNWLKLDWHNAREVKTAPFEAMVIVPYLDGYVMVMRMFDDGRKGDLIEFAKIAAKKYNVRVFADERLGILFHKNMLWAHPDGTMTAKNELDLPF